MPEPRGRPAGPNPAEEHLVCPQCGAPADAGQRQCTFCRAPIATLRCAACFHHNNAASAHCAACGRRLNEAAPAVPASLHCARCSERMERTDTGEGAFFDCARCGGQWVEHRLLRQLLEQRDRVAREVPGPVPPCPNPLEREVRYLRCAVCGATMNRRNFGGGSGIIVDVCRSHGTWFDAGELSQVLAFVEAGGLARIRAQQSRPRNVYGPASAGLSDAMVAGLIGAELAPALVDVVDLSLSAAPAMADGAEVASSIAETLVEFLFGLWSD